MSGISFLQFLFHFLIQRVFQLSDKLRRSAFAESMEKSTLLQIRNILRQLQLLQNVVQFNDKTFHEVERCLFDARAIALTLPTDETAPARRLLAMIQESASLLLAAHKRAMQRERRVRPPQPASPLTQEPDLPTKLSALSVLTTKVNDASFYDSQPSLPPFVRCSNRSCLLSFALGGTFIRNSNFSFKLPFHPNRQSDRLAVISNQAHGSS